MTSYTYGCNSGVNVMGATNNFLIRYKDHSKEEHTSGTISLTKNT